MFDRNQFYKDHVADYSKCMKRIKEYKDFEAFQAALNMDGGCLYSLTRESNHTVDGVNRLLTSLVQAFLDDGQYIVVREELFPQIRERLRLFNGNRPLDPHYTYRFELNYDRPGINEEDFLHVVELYKYKTDYYKENMRAIESGGLVGLREPSHPLFIWRTHQKAIETFMETLYQEQELNYVGEDLE